MSIRFQYIIYIVVIASLLTPTQSKAQAELYGISLKDTSKYKNTWEDAGGENKTYFIPGDLHEYPFDSITTGYFLESGIRSIFLVDESKHISDYIRMYERIVNKYGEAQVSVGITDSLLYVSNKDMVTMTEIQLMNNTKKVERGWLVGNDFITLYWQSDNISLHIAPQSLISYIADYQGR